MFLEDNWNRLIASQDAKNVELPPRMAGTYNSWNTADRNLIMMGEFIRLRKPKVFLECGMFEGRTTEYIGKIMAQEIDNPTIIAIEAGHYIDNIVDGVATYKEDDENWFPVVRARELRMETLKTIDNLNFIYHEGLVGDLLEPILSQYRVEFIYQDASHVSEWLKSEWPPVERHAIPGDIVCIDDAFLDMPGNFFDWMEHHPDWLTKRNIEGGVRQLWCEKR